MQLSKGLIEKFIQDPDWKIIEEFIIEFFDNDTSIQSIDTDKGSDVVHAQVIAKQQIDETIKKLMTHFESAKSVKSNSKISYK